VYINVEAHNKQYNAYHRVIRSTIISSSSVRCRSLSPDVGQLASDISQLSSDVGQLSSDVGQLSSDVGRYHQM